MKITAVKGKSSVLVLNWGGAPFAKEVTKRGIAIVPSGFKVEVKSDSKVWFAETRVERNLPYYQFSLKEDPTLCSDWRDNPTAAYKEASERCGNDKFSKGSNGRLIIGVTYDNLQKQILSRLQEELKAVPRLLEELARGIEVYNDRSHDTSSSAGESTITASTSSTTASAQKRKRTKLLAAGNIGEKKPEETDVASVSQILLDIAGKN